MIPKFTYKILKSITASVIALSLLASSVTAASLSYIGNVYHKEENTVSPGFSVSELYAEDDTYGKQKAFIFDYKPGNGTYPISISSEGVYGKSALSSIISYASENGKNIVGGVNGDFFGFATGIPMGCMISGGRILASSDERASLGFYSDGSAIIGYPNIKMNFLSSDGKTYPVTFFNKYPSLWGAYLLSGDFSATTQSTEESTEIVIDILSGDFKANSSVSGIVREVRLNSVNSEIPENCMVFCISNRFANFSDYAALTEGMPVTLNITADEKWNGVVEAVGGEDIIVSGGQTVEGIVNETHEQTANPRLSAGIKDDGTVIFFAADGRQTDYSKGVKLLELADIMKELGCVTAINLDGGGSLTVAAKHYGDESAHIINSPSDGYQRKIANALLFVNEAQKTDIPGHLYISAASSSVVLAGSTVDLNISVLDSSYSEVSGDYSEASYFYDCSNGIGYASSGKFTASASAAQGKITAHADIFGVNISGSASVTVTDKLDSLSVTPVELALIPNSTMGINIQAVWRDLPVAFSYDALKYSFADGGTENTYPNAVASGKLGYITNDGVFHSYPKVSGSDTIKISYGDVSCEVKITVSDFSGMILHDFEAGEASLSAIDIFVSGNADITLSVTENGKNRSKGLAFKYSFNDLTATETDEYGEEYSLFDEFTESVRFGALKYSSPVTIPEGALYIDVWVKNQNIGKAYITVADTEGTEYDIPYDVAKDFSSFNGWRLMRAYLGETSGLSLISPFKLVYSDKAEASGTIVLDSIYMATDKLSYVFEDSRTSWAVNFIEDMYYMEIADGTISDNLRYYNPSNDLTRQEFAKMLVSFLGINTSSFSGVELNFTDKASIASWAEEYVRAVVGSGYMSGSGNSDGTVSFNPDNKITRQEVMQVFGNLLKSLGAVNEGSALSFADSHTVAQWAYENVLLTVAASIITGYEDNTIRPGNYITRAEIAAVFIRSTDKIRKVN